MDLTINVGDYKLNVRAAAIIIHNNKLLVHKNINSNHYAWIGGRVEAGEDSESTVKREIQEEIGKKVEITGYISTIENFFKMKSKTPVITDRCRPETAVKCEMPRVVNADFMLSLSSFLLPVVRATERPPR